MTRDVLRKPRFPSLSPKRPRWSVWLWVGLIAVNIAVFLYHGDPRHLLDELFEEHNENITMVRYHWNSPNPGDPMYHYNSEDVELRIQMYSVLFCHFIYICLNILF